MISKKKSRPRSTARICNGGVGKTRRWREAKTSDEWGAPPVLEKGGYQGANRRPTCCEGGATLGGNIRVTTGD